MSRPLSTIAFLFIAACGLHAQTPETWVTTQGAMFEASVQKVVPGQATFILKDGREQTVPLADLSERSRAKLAEALGLGGVQAPVAAATATAPAAPETPATPPAAPAPAPVPMNSATALQDADAAAIDATDAAQIQSQIGQDAIVVGIVTEVVTLGAAGHKLIKFDSSPFNVFIAKQQIEQSADWVLDDLPGKRLQVSGKLETYRDAPQIRGTNPAQLVRVK